MYINNFPDWEADENSSAAKKEITILMTGGDIEGKMNYRSLPPVLWRTRRFQ
jgi:hypothetical protein